jgi:pantoate--beta-alanine ligase
MTPELIHSPEAMSAWCEAARRAGRRVGFVPTMGCLHEGHLSLVAAAARVADVVVVSIFVNPTQFGPNEDFDKYPRVLEADLDKLRKTAVAAVFAPSPAEMYPGGFDTEVVVGGLTGTLCGAHRPGHFNGVATVVTKLLGIVGPCAAVFGRKDYQQLKIIQKLVRDLNLPVEVVPAPTVREPDGLAMSSRNAYLSADERARALSLSRGLRAARALFEQGERRAGTLRSAAAAAVEAAGDKVDYVEIADPESLVSFDENNEVRGCALIAVAVRIGGTRLIDNTVLGEA